ncbi:aldehyde dehydrogenase family protein [Facklamia sp. DSM 111018]|uniref:Aldehyde dehydrogenase family protein n=1 Tax=Facklamia lactis TaxID=2749967 RepID=A0ABS0LTK3_9LACT|nr:aldehyde dehydrogenase family protein [Facklamia lactis]MBG9980951.1 aldehyde dehydrogenase family protein [Facklamia lactis]MBG9986686.1 aldehyde dehydrogenase family protein [Facklamia lactis]
MKTYKLFIDGKWVDSVGTEICSVINPTNEEIVAEIPMAINKDVDKAVEAAKNAFPHWNALNPDERIPYLQKVADGIRERKEEILQSIIVELGAARSFAEYNQVERSADEIEASIQSLSKINFETEIENARIIKEGIGVVAAINPWNFPLNQIQRKITSALLAGNTVVVKPASETPTAAIILTEIIEAAGFPKGVFNLLTGSGSQMGAYLAGHPDVGLISFTGSTEVGKSLFEKAKTTVKHLVLELGGKSALVLLEGGDPELAIKTSIDTLTNNTGQICTALSRLIVPQNRLQEIEEIATKYVQSLKVGDPNEKDTIMGPLVSMAQKEKVMEFIEKGKNEGAKLIVGGKSLPDKGYFVEPTIFSQVDNQMAIAQEEIFGPVLSIIPYQTVEEALTIANDTKYGLSGAVVGPEEEAFDFAKKMRTGMVLINGAGQNNFAPFGGYKESGLGHERGHYGIEDYLETKSIFK